MRFEQVKKASQIFLTNIKAEVDETGSNHISRVRLTDEWGNFVEFRDSAYDSVKAFVKAPPKMEKRWVLEGSFAGLAWVREEFDSEYEAQKRLREFEKKHSGPNEDVGLTVTEQEVEVED